MATFFLGLGSVSGASGAPIIDVRRIRRSQSDYLRFAVIKDDALDNAALRDPRSHLRSVHHYYDRVGRPLHQAGFRRMPARRDPEEMNLRSIARLEQSEKLRHYRHVTRDEWE